MSDVHVHPVEYVILLADDEPGALEVLQRDLFRICGTLIPVEGFASAADLLARMDELAATRVRVPLVLTDQLMPDMSGVDLLVALSRQPAGRPVRKVLLSDHSSVEDVIRALNHDALHRNLAKPWRFEDMEECVRALLTDFFIHESPKDLDRFPGLVDVGRLSTAYTVAERQRRVLDDEVKVLTRSFLVNMDLSDEELEQALVEDIDLALDHPPRRQYPAGSVLLRQDEPIDTLLIVVSGQVELSRDVEGREILLHSRSAGPVVGLLSLARQQRAFFSCRAGSDLTVIPLSLDDLEVAMQKSSRLSVHFVTTLIRSLETRNKHMTELKFEVEKLNIRLERERDQLREALEQLEQAQIRLVESEKMVTLGQMAAGLAHELNNPIASIRRSTDLIAEDLISLVAEFPDGEPIKAAMLNALTSQPISTRELRQRSGELGKVVKDEALTRRLVKLGIHTPQAYRERFARLAAGERERVVLLMERYHELGASLRNIGSGGDRIAGLVKSLRSYARSGPSDLAAADLHEGLEDTLRLFNHALGAVVVDRTYGELPPVQCRPGEVNQVWTNLISNALHAMAGNGTLTVETTVADGEHVRVRIIDTGPGIPAEVLGRIFDLHFTTKDGRVTFGMGMGLPICRQIISKHGGSISVESKPGRTCFTVLLPIRYPGPVQHKVEP